MNAIFASKLYKTSTRKKKIASALNNPLNTELIQQLRSYVEDTDDIVDAVDDKIDEIEDKTISNDKSSKMRPSFEPSTKTTPSTVEFDPTSEETDSDFESIEPNDKTDGSAEDQISEEELKLKRFHKPAEEDDDSDKVEESVNITGTAVQASYCDNIRIDSEILKGTLNSRDDTKGVSRVNYKDDELWVYYQDKVNLNSIMEPVISVLNASNFSYLEFNRLARSSNAIVFEVTCVPDQVEPMEEISNE